MDLVNLTSESDSFTPEPATPVYPHNPFDALPSASFSGSSLPSSCGTAPSVQANNRSQECYVMGSWAEREKLYNRINQLISENFNIRREKDGKEAAVQSISRQKKVLTEEKQSLQREVERLNGTVGELLDTATRTENRAAQLTAANETLTNKVKLHSLEQSLLQGDPSALSRRYSADHLPAVSSLAAPQLAVLELNISNEATRETSPVVVLNLQSFICSLENSLRLLQEEDARGNHGDATHAGVVVKASDVYILVGFLKRVREYYNSLCEKLREAHTERSAREAEASAQAAQLQMRVDYLTQELGSLQARSRWLVDLGRELEAAGTATEIDQAQVASVLRQLRALDPQAGKQDRVVRSKRRGRLARAVSVLLKLGLLSGVGYAVYRVTTEHDLTELKTYVCQCGSLGSYKDMLTHIAYKTGIYR